MSESGCITVLAWLWAAIWFFLGMFAMGTYWKIQIVEQGRAYYIVDPNTGDTELIWRERR